MSKEKPPPCCFIDTSYIEAQAFSFAGTAFKVLRARTSSGSVSVVTSDLSLREVQHRAAKRLSEAAELLSKAKKASYILKSMSPKLLSGLEATCTAISSFDAHDATSSLLVDYFDSCSATQLKQHSVDMQKVFEKYFDQTPPFGGSKKKCEFADACFMEMLDQHHRAIGCDVHIVSIDGDFSGCTPTRSWLHVHKSLIEFIRTLPRTDSDLVRDAEALLHDHWDAIAELVQKEAEESITLFVDDLNGDLFDIECTNIYLGNPRFDAMDDHRVAASFDAVAACRFQVRVSDPEKSYYDKEDGYVALAYREGSADKDVEVSVQLEFDINNLHADRITPDSIAVEQLGSNLIDVDPYAFPEDESFYD